MKTIFQKLGFTKKEAKVYLAALELGSSSVQNIGKKAEVNRVTTYVILNTLAKKGLITSFEKGKKRYFSAENPEQLLKILNKEEIEIKEKKEQLKEVFPEIQAIYNFHDGKPKVRFFEGLGGLKAMQQDAIRESTKGQEIYAITPLDKYLTLFPKQETVKDRLKRKIKLNVIYTSSKGKISNEENKKSNRNARYVPLKKFGFESSFDIFPQGFVRIYNFTPSFTGVIIQDKQIAKTMKAFFDLAWESAEKYNKK